jgi:hypothetical protein
MQEYIDAVKIYNWFEEKENKDIIFSVKTSKAVFNDAK